jgi:hypothetical protein
MKIITIPVAITMFLAACIIIVLYIGILWLALFLAFPPLEGWCQNLFIKLQENAERLGLKLLKVTRAIVEFFDRD